jgi:hypothetical protein
MDVILSRRGFLRGLFAAPAVIAAQRLMPLRGIIMPTDEDMLLVQERIAPGLIDVDAVRNLLLPELFDVRDVRGAYEMIPRQWEKMFRDEYDATRADGRNP